MMWKFFWAVALVLWSTADCLAQAESVTLQVPLAEIPCTSQINTLGDNQVLYLENYFDAIQSQIATLPINRVTFWWDGGAPIPSAIFGNVTYAIDPGRSYITSVGYPTKQLVWPYSLKTLGIWESVKGSRKQVDEYAAPKIYRTGQDAIIVASECPGIGSIDGAFLAIDFSSIGDIPPPPAQNYVFNLPYANLKSTWNVPPYAIRSWFPGALFAVTSIRVHVSWTEQPPPVISNFPSAIKIDHIGVAAQVGSTSAAAATPIELTFNGNPGVALQLRQWAWSDCISINIPAGQNILISSSLNQPIPSTPPNQVGGNAWSYSDGNQSDSWIVQDPTQWNALALSGAVSFQSGRIHVVDRVQVNCR